MNKLIEDYPCFYAEFMDLINSDPDFEYPEHEFREWLLDNDLLVIGLD
jgi:hypothetical protein